MSRAKVQLLLKCALSLLLAVLTTGAVKTGVSLSHEGKHEPSSSCISLSIPGSSKKICALKFACWTLSQPDEIVIYDENPDGDVLGLYSQEKIAKLWDGSQSLWWNITLSGARCVF